MKTIEEQVIFDMLTQKLNCKKLTQNLSNGEIFIKLIQKNLDVQ